MGSKEGVTKPRRNVWDAWRDIAGPSRSATRRSDRWCSSAAPQPKLFRLDALGKTGWLKTLRLEGYAPGRSRGSSAPQEVLFTYLDALA